MPNVDMLVIGSGPAGRRAAVQSAKLGKSVLVVDRGRRLGGVSVHTGTIPSKTLRETVLNLSGWRERGFYGRGYRVKQDITASDLMQRLHKTLDHEVEVLQHQFMRNMVQSASGEARFVDQNHVELTEDDGDTVHVTFDKALIATGTRPFRPDHVPFDDTRVFDSDSILEIPALPRSMTVIGGGVIGVEYATIFSALDVPVTLIESRESILNFVDTEIVDDFIHQMRDRGIVIRLGATVDTIEKADTGITVALTDGRKVRSEVLLFAAGRSGSVEALNLPAIGVEPDKRGRIKVDPKTFQTSAPNIYAAGDIIGFPSLASTSMEQGRVAACHAFDMPPPPAPATFPYGIYAVPEISTVGQSEDEVRASGVPYECGIARFRETSRGHIMGVDAGFLKLIFALDDRRLLGAHIVGEGATELIHIGQAVINLGGGVDFFVENTFNYPTLAEAYKVAGLDAWNRMGQPEPGQ
ncbi:Si-specific NAD(P)(+) transhydrogenase [Psychromarinibacter halotolerans]|uniref:Soluble pyridine nucleotide transhydrogenase n=1 Tax=Psychromarinibacter halotolerans TaxID=1775175 RepID=A0ABV7GJU0_9RHOB|nr:Si-specific NAD(P)(+) transhydrogenase [Psychromarinibacter halotolerans]MAQ83405.1 Si-specific NAD(P)(+) transhydrogenase [Maritimibacter sp.]MDF0595713.1 Si-specific NAD(P)(+) transhydrogenase [Psychromarinibacter halotolerans]